MKRFLLTLAVALMALPIAAAQNGDPLKKLEKVLEKLPAGKSEVTVADGVVTIRASDPFDAVPTILTERERHKTKPLKLVVLPAKEITLDEFLAAEANGKPIPIEISTGKDLDTVFREKLTALAKEDGKLRDLLTGDPLSIRKHLDYLERKFTITVPENANIIERTRRATWHMMLPRNDLASIRFE